MAYKALFFDLDGTLINSLDDLADSMNMVLEKHGYPTHSTNAYRKFIGDGARKLTERALPDAIAADEAKLDAFLTEYLEVYGSGRHQSTAPYPGVEPLIDWLGERGITRAIVTNKPHQKALRVVDSFFGEVFDGISGQQEGRPVKPDPTLALEQAAALGLQPEEILYLGDSNVDMQLAVAAGFHPVGVSWGFRDRHELEEAGAAVIIDDATELHRFFA